MDVWFCAPIGAAIHKPISQEPPPRGTIAPSAQRYKLVQDGFAKKSKGTSVCPLDFTYHDCPRFAEFPFSPELFEVLSANTCSLHEE